MPRRKSKSPNEVSWGLATGLLAGCAVTLVGIVLNLPPVTILYRSLISGCVIGVMATTVTFGWQLVTPPEQEEE